MSEIIRVPEFRFASSRLSAVVQKHTFKDRHGNDLMAEMFFLHGKYVIRIFSAMNALWKEETDKGYEAAQKLFDEMIEYFQ